MTNTSLWIDKEREAFMSRKYSEIIFDSACLMQAIAPDPFLCYDCLKKYERNSAVILPSAEPGFPRQVTGIEPLNELIKCRRPIYKTMKIAAVCVILDSNNRILFLQRKNPVGTFCLPGGKVEESDQSIKHAAAREVLEETGIDLSKVEIVKAGEVPSLIGEFIVHVFFCRITEAKVTLSSEHLGYMWTEPEYVGVGFELAGNTGEMVKICFK